MDALHVCTVRCWLQSSQQQVESTLQEMVEQKNKLAYEKGKLQTQVSTLQRDVEALSGASNELSQQKRLGAALEAKVSKVHCCLDTSVALSLTSCASCTCTLRFAAFD